MVAFLHSLTKHAQTHTDTLVAVLQSEVSTFKKAY